MNVPSFVNMSTVLVLCHTVDIIFLENFTMLLTAICSPGAAALVLFAVHQGRCVTIAPTTGNDVKKRGHWAELMNYRKADIVSAARRMALQNGEVIN
jgi:hypothetical protein